MKRPYRRRRILIDAFQYRLLLANLVYSGTIVLVFALVEPYARLWPALFIVLVLLAFHSVLLTHRIAGPLYRFRSVLRAVAEGDLSVLVRIRPTDYLTREADLLNEMIAALRQKISSVGEQSVALRAAFSELKRALEDGSQEGIDELLEEVDTGMAYLEARLGQFRVVSHA